MGPRNRSQHRLTESLRRLAELGGEVALVDAHINWHDGGGAHARGQLAQDVVVDQGDPDVLVAPSLAPARIHFTEEV